MICTVYIPKYVMLYIYIVRIVAIPDRQIVFFFLNISQCFNLFIIPYVFTHSFDAFSDNVPCRWSSK